MITTNSSTYILKRFVFSGKLDLIPILGNHERSNEYLGMLLVIERTNLANLFPKWRERGEKSDEISTGRVGTVVDWIYYDPIVRRAIGELHCLPF